MCLRLLIMLKWIDINFLSTYFALFMDLTEMKFNIIGFLIYL